jgi:hypothetical protein
MKTKSILILSALLLWGALPSTIIGQPPGPPAALLREMAKLKFLTGTWRGDGWIEFAPGQRHNFSSSEEVQFKLDGVVLLVEGIHKIRVPNQASEMKIHHALATVTYDESAKNYRFDAHKFDGKSVETRGEFKDGAFIWGFKDPQFGQMRYTIRVNAQGQWSEIGERSSDGAAWTKFFEMTLSKGK